MQSFIRLVKESDAVFCECSVDVSVGDYIFSLWFRKRASWRPFELREVVQTLAGHCIQNEQLWYEVTSPLRVEG
jgi:hypothetical protein